MTPSSSQITAAPNASDARHGQRLGDDRRDRDLVVVVVAEVAVQRVADEAQVLLPDRLVEPQPLVDQRDRLRRGLAAAEGPRDVARAPTKNMREHAPCVISQMTSRPRRARRTRKRITLGLDVRRRLGGEEPVGARVERVAHAVAEEVEGQRGDQQRDAGEEQEPPGDVGSSCERSSIIPPQSAVGGGTPSPRKDSVASDDDHHRDQQRRVDDDRRQHVGQHVDEHDPPGRPRPASGPPRRTPAPGSTAPGRARCGRPTPS